MWYSVSRFPISQTGNLRNTQKFCSMFGVHLNTCQCFEFLPPSRSSFPDEYSVPDTVSVLRAESVQYLGVTICTSLWWFLHIFDGVKRIHRLPFPICRRLAQSDVKQTVIITTFVHQCDLSILLHRLFFQGYTRKLFTQHHSPLVLFLLFRFIFSLIIRGTCKSGPVGKFYLQTLPIPYAVVYVPAICIYPFVRNIV